MTQARFFRRKDLRSSDTGLGDGDRQTSSLKHNQRHPTLNEVRLGACPSGKIKRVARCFDQGLQSGNCYMIGRPKWRSLSVGQFGHMM